MTGVVGGVHWVSWDRYCHAYGCTSLLMKVDAEPGAVTGDQALALYLTALKLNDLAAKATQIVPTSHLHGVMADRRPENLARWMLAATD